MKARKLSRKEKQAQLVLHLPPTGTVVAKRKSYSLYTKQELVDTLHTQLYVLYRIINKHHGRYLPARDPVISAAMHDAHRVLNDTHKFVTPVTNTKESK